MQARLSICIPVLNEAARLPRLLADLAAQRDVTLDIVVADGGSTDGSARVLSEAVRVVVGAHGRGAQLNAAARAARGDWLLFMHADTRLGSSGLLADAVEALNAAHIRAGHDRIAGHFPLHFERGQARHERLFRYMEAKTALNRRGTINGDQGMLLTRRFFQSLGGFDESRPLLEDQVFAERVFSAGDWMTLPGRVATSARRFETLGPWRVYAFMALIMVAWRVGNEPFLDDVPALYAGQLRRRAVLAAWRRSWRAQPRKTRGRWSLTILRYAGRNAWQVTFLIGLILKPFSRREQGGSAENRQKKPRC